MFQHKKDKILNFIVTKSNTDSKEIHLSLGINHDTVYTYCQEFEKEGLVRFIEGSGLSPYSSIAFVSALPQARHRAISKRFYLWNNFWKFFDNAKNRWKIIILLVISIIGNIIEWIPKIYFYKLL